jgi:hypothetical protein
MKKSTKTFSAWMILYSSLLFLFSCSKSSVSNSTSLNGSGNGDNSQAILQYQVTTVMDHIPTPQGLTMDMQGNLYIASLGNAAIEKIFASGQKAAVTGFGSALNLLIGAPEGITNDMQGNLYFTDASNGVIDRISASGLFSTIAGNNSAGNADGIGTVAQFNNPFGIAIDLQGNLFVTDAGNSAIRKITASGLVSTVVSTSKTNNLGGKTVSQGLGRPEGIAIDGQGNLYVTDVEHAAILKISSSGIISTIAGGQALGYADGLAQTALFNKPMGIGKITTLGIVSTIAGGKTIGFADGIGSAAEFNSPEGITIDSDGNLYVSDGCYGAVRKVSVF